MDLLNLAPEYLKSCQYEVSTRGKDLLIGHKLSQFAERETVLVWVPKIEAERAFSTQESFYLSRFQDDSRSYPRSKKYMLVPSYEGLSKQFRQNAIKLGVSILVPIFFFDTPFKSEELIGGEARSAASELKEKGEQWSKARIPQPYTEINGDRSSKRLDLLEVLLKTIENREGSRLNLIVGPAGIGKSVLFEVLFAKLYSKFINAKRAMTIFPRPLPLIPQYIRMAFASNIDSLIDAFLRTEFAAPIGKETFQWMLTNGFGIWLIDGLDELIERDPTFFSDKLLNILTSPGRVEPVIILCIRDSLLATNADLKEFLDEYENSVKIYELAKWELPSKRAFAKTQFVDKEVEAFLSVLQKHTELNSLSSIPYYCKLITDEYKVGKIKDSYNETVLLNDAIWHILEREYAKDLLDKILLPQRILLEILQDLASEDAVNNFSGLTRDIIRQYTEMALTADCDRLTLEKIITNMIQLALFSKTESSGQVRFAQEILAQHLLGERLFRNLKKDETNFLNELSTLSIPFEWVTLKTVAAEIGSNSSLITKILNWLEQPLISDLAFKNLLQICTYVIKDPSAFKKFKFEGRNISGLCLIGLDLRGINFRQCDLTDVAFVKCLLEDCLFEGAIINRTTFDLMERDSLKNAKFGNMERIHSIITRIGKSVLPVREAKKWLIEQAGSIDPMIEPCDASLQLRFLFGKFVYPNGRPRRAHLDKRGVLTGKMFFDPEEALKIAIKHQYLNFDEQHRDCVSRCEGDKYGELVEYVKDLRLSYGIRRLLDELCHQNNCPHIPVK